MIISVITYTIYDGHMPNFHFNFHTNTFNTLNTKLFKSTECINDVLVYLFIYFFFFSHVQTHIQKIFRKFKIQGIQKLNVKMYLDIR